MSTTLTYSRVRPEVGDPASVWMPALRGNVTTDDAHTHNGVNSALLPPGAFNKGSAVSTIASASWTNDGGGNYSAVVTVPSIISTDATYNDFIFYNLVCRINTAGTTYGDVVYPGIERETATTFTVRVNDPTLDLIIYYQ